MADPNKKHGGGLLGEVQVTSKQLYHLKVYLHLIEAASQSSVFSCFYFLYTLASMKITCTPGKAGRYKWVDSGKQPMNPHWELLITLHHNHTCTNNFLLNKLLLEQITLKRTYGMVMFYLQDNVIHVEKSRLVIHLCCIIFRVVSDPNVVQSPQESTLRVTQRI